jgi:predicted  nucleic acid-binding Zn-ribbon protein
MNRLRDNENRQMEVEFRLDSETSCSLETYQITLENRQNELRLWSRQLTRLRAKFDDANNARQIAELNQLIKNAHAKIAEIESFIASLYEDMKQMEDIRINRWRWKEEEEQEKKLKNIFCHICGSVECKPLNDASRGSF